VKASTYPRRGLHGEVVHTIGVRIVGGDLRPGDPLPPEDELISDLAVSRTVLREAVRVLAAKGLVEARPKTGTRVRAREDWNILDPDVLSWRIEATNDSGLYDEATEMRLGIEPLA
jgi:DNA-binding FadR family transcriptional regulator